MRSPSVRFVVTTIALTLLPAAAAAGGDAVPGACCLADGVCVESDELACIAEGGLFVGAETTCARGSCDLPVRAVAEMVDEGAPEGLATVRIWLEFDVQTTQVLAFGESGIGAQGPFRLELTSDLVNAGGTFSGFAEEDIAAEPRVAPWDSWLTLQSESFVGNDTAFTPGFLGGDGVLAAFVGHSFTSFGGWFDYFPDTLLMPDENGRVLIMQITLEEQFNAFVGVVMRGTAAFQFMPGALMTVPVAVDFSLAPGGPGFAGGESLTFGACCLPDGACTVIRAGDCAAAGGTYQGTFVGCAEGDCAGPPPGACCLPYGTCFVGSPAACTGAGGTFLGSGSACGMQTCGGPPPCPDFDGDGQVGFYDINYVLSAWGQCGECYADLNGDGTVDVMDLTTALSGWGTCP